MSNMTEQELFDVPVPKETDSYAPVSHESIVGEIKENVDKTGLEIVNTRYQTGSNGAIVTGFMDLEAPESDVFNYRLAFQNSYNKWRPLAFVAGTSVMICSNGMILGDMKFVRRHTGSIATEMKTQIETTITGVEDLLIKSVHEAEQMKLVDLDPTATAELCGRLFMEQEIITSSQLNIIKKQLKEPNHEEFSDPNLWSLYNHTTHALKKTHAYEYTQKHKELQEFVEAEYI